MKKVLLLIVIFVCTVSAQTGSGAVNFLITKDSVGPIKLGMTVGEAQKALPSGWKLGPTPGDEGYTFIGVFEGKKLLLEVGVYEDSNASATLPPLDPDQEVRGVTIVDPRFKTADGVGVGMPIAEVEKRFGKLKEMFDYPHVGEFGSFTHNPRWINFTFKPKGEDGRAGIYKPVECGDPSYPPSCRKATEYTTGSYIGSMSIIIPEPPRITTSIEGLPSDLSVVITGPNDCGDQPGMTEYGVWTTIDGVTYPQFFKFEGLLPCLDPDENPVERKEKYKDQYNFYYGDFNFDGATDIALRDGMGGGYGAPTYQVYLLDPAKHKYFNSPELTKLAQYQGMFEVKPDEKMIYVSSKSGCCFHQVEGYKVVADKPVKVYDKTIEAARADSDSDDPTITIKRLIDGKWKKVSN